MRVSAGLCFQGERVWILKRGEGRKNAHLWEFPGGKEEQGETPAECLRRELQEELSLSITAPAAFAEGDWAGIHFTFLRCEALNQPRLTEHEDCALVLPRALGRYAFCPADVPVARRLLLSQPPVTAFFWDLDGTLLDTYAAMVPCLCTVLAGFGAAAEPTRVLSLMKDSLSTCIRTLAAEAGIPEGDLGAAFTRAEEALPLACIRPMPGIPETLAFLSARGARHFLVTHRGASALRYLTACGLTPLFADAVTGLDDFPRKPAPDGLLHLMRKHHLAPASCLMVGDRPLDVDAARNAGIDGCLLDPEGRFAAHDCALHLERASELIEALR